MTSPNIYEFTIPEQYIIDTDEAGDLPDVIYLGVNSSIFKRGSEYKMYSWSQYDIEIGYHNANEESRMIPAHLVRKLFIRVDTLTDKQLFTFRMTG